MKDIEKLNILAQGCVFVFEHDVNALFAVINLDRLGLATAEQLETNRGLDALIGGAGRKRSADENDQQRGEDPDEWTLQKLLGFHS